MIRMQKEFPREYGFFPKTWVLPVDLPDFKTQFSSDGKSNKTFIIKPDAGCQGKGIFLTRNLNEIDMKEGCLVAQRYIKKPLLIEGFKFDLRLYVFVASCDPLRIYLFNDGLTRLCTTQYVKPTNDNMAQRCMHLTNYAINKHSDDFEFNEDADDDGSGSKRSLRWFMKWLAETQGEEKAQMAWGRMADLVNKMMIAVAPVINTESKSGMPHGHTSEMPSRCFEVLGVDVMIDENLKPWLIEVNHLPSFKCDTPLDRDIKKRLIEQTLAMLECNGRDRRRYQQAAKEKARDRLEAGISKSKQQRQEIEERIRNQKELEARRLGRRPQQREPPPIPERPPPPGNGNDQAGQVSAGGATEGGSATAGAAAPATSSSARDGSRRPQPPTRLRVSSSAGGSRSPSASEPEPTAATAGAAALASEASESDREAASPTTNEEEEEQEEGDASGEEEEEEEGLVDYERIFPPPKRGAGGGHAGKDYSAMIAKAEEQFAESQARFRAPLQQKKGEVDVGGGTALLPPIVNKRAAFGRDCFGVAGTDRARDALAQHKRLTAKPSREQVDMASRLMHGYSSNSGQHISHSAPASLYRVPDRSARDGVAYGLAYQKKVQAKQRMPTMKLKTCSIGFGADFGIGF
jgi:tubulin polyglutamylase TTLL6/13